MTQKKIKNFVIYTTKIVDGNLFRMYNDRLYVPLIRVEILPG